MQVFRMSSLTQLLCEEVFQWRLSEFPEFATLCGCHDHNARLNDHSVAAYEKRKTLSQEFLRRINVLEAQSEMSESDSLDLMLLKEDLMTFERGIQCKGYLFSLNCNEGIHLDFNHQIRLMPFETLKDFQTYLERLSTLPDRIASDIELMRYGLSIGQIHYRGSMVDVPRQIDAILNVDVADSSFFKPLLTMPNNIISSDKKNLTAAAKQLLIDKIWPSFLQLKEFIVKAYLPECRVVEGISNVPGGLKFYQECLRYHISTEMSPQEIHDVGLKEIASIQKRMDQVMTKTGFTGSIAQFVKHLRNDPQFYFTTKKDCLEGFRDVCFQRIRPVLGRAFLRLPLGKLSIEEEEGDSASVAYYRAGSADGARPGRYMICMQDLKMCPKYNMMTLSLHEAEPGHHLQAMYLIEAQGIPRFRQLLEDMYYSVAPSKFPIHTAHVEGWALYSEFLGYELGLYEDPYVEFGHLSYQMLRTCRLVVDTGLHAFDWTSERAVQLLLENTALPESDIRNEVRRYIIWPGQACAYRIGELKIRELRQKAEKKLGDLFDLRSFHEEILRYGMIPLTVLERLVNAYIIKKGSKNFA